MVSQSYIVIACYGIISVMGKIIMNSLSLMWQD